MTGVQTCALPIWLENALKPFANHAEKYADIMPDSMMVMEYLFRFRDAKEALKKDEPT